MMHLALYLIAHFAKSQLWHASTLLFVFFLTERCGLGAMQTGWIIGISLLANAAADMVLGRTWRGAASVGTVSRLQAVYAPLSAAFFILSCATALVAPSIRLGWALVAILGFRLTYPLIDVPQNALVPLLMDTSAGRCRLLALRNITSQGANVCVSATAAPLLILRPDDWTYFAWAIAVGSLSCASAALLTRVRLPAFAPAMPEDAPAGSTPGYRPLLILLALMVAAGAIFRMLEPYYAAFVAPGQGFLIWAALGALIAQPVWLIASDRIGTSAALCLTAGIVIVAAILLLTPLRTGSLGAPLIALGYGAGTGALWLALWSAVVVNANRRTAMAHVGGVTGISKASQGIAAILIGHVLQPDGNRQTLSDPLSPESLSMVLSLLVIAACCLSLAILSLAFGPTRKMSKPWSFTISR